MSLSIWNPVREMERIMTGFRPDLDRPSSQHDLTAADWLPTVDIHESSESYDIKVELPGVEKKDVQVSVDNGVLTIRGDKRAETRQEDSKCHRVECSYGTFVRRFSLPDEVDDGKINAAYKDGILDLHIPKTEAAKPRSIKVDVK